MHGGKPWTAGDVPIVVDVKSETWMSGDIYFLPMAVCKEGYDPLTGVYGVTRRLIIGKNWVRTRVLHGL